jgi:alpha-D-ribose 1-methylphosphonate 5-triphosphate synthase subunit PhnH
MPSNQNPSQIEMRTPSNQNPEKIGESLLRAASLKPSPGFDDLTLASQQVFRLALSAMSRPTQKFYFNFQSLFKAKPPLPYSVAALTLTLADHLTPIWLSPSFQSAASFLIFHTSAPMVTVPEKAQLILAASRKELPDLGSLNQGDPRYPDRSATIILADDSLADDSDEATPGLTFAAFGPGLAGEVTFQSRSLDDSFALEWIRNRASYPMGVDLFLVDSESLTALPRSLSLIPKAS